MPVTLDTLLLEFAADFSQYDAAVNDAERRHMAAAKRLESAYSAVKPPNFSDLKVNVDLSQLHELNRLYNVVKPNDHKAFQRFLDANPLKVKTDTSQLVNAIALIKDLRGELTSLKSEASIQAKLTVTHQIDGRQVGDQIRSASKDGAEEYEKAIGKAFRDNRPSGGGVLGSLFSIPNAVIQGIGIQVGDRISRGFGKATDSSLEAFGRGLDKQINRAVQTMTIGLAKAGGYGSAKDFRKDADQTIDNLTNFSPQRVNRAIRKLEDNLVDVLESAVVDGDQAAVSAKLKKLQTEMLERPIEAAMNTAGAALRIGAQPFRIRKRVELSRTVKEAEGMVDEILQDMSEELKDQIRKAKGVTIATGGIDYQKGGENTYFSANLVRKLTPGNVTIPSPNTYSNDPSTLGTLYKARQAVFPGAPMPVDRLLRTAVETGRNPDAAKMLAQVMAVRKIAPDTPITLTGSSGGAALVEEVVGAVERAAIAKVKGVGLTLPGFDLTRTASKNNYKALVGSYDPIAVSAFGNLFNDGSENFLETQKKSIVPFPLTGLLTPGVATSVIPKAGLLHNLAKFLGREAVQTQFTEFTGTGQIDPGYTKGERSFSFANKLYDESQSIPRTIGVILGDLKALSEVAKGEYSFIDPGNPSYRRDNDFAAMSGNFEKLNVSGADVPEHEKFLAWLKTFKRELTAFYEMAGTHEGMMPKGLTDAAKQGQDFFKFRSGVFQPEYNAPLNIPNAPEKVYELATNGANAVSSALEKLSPVGDAAASVLSNVAQGLGNIAGDRLQKRVDNLRGEQTGQRGTAGELGKIAAQDIATVKQVGLQATEQVVKFADGTIKAGKAARDFVQGMISQGRTIQDLGDAVVEVSAELVSEFEGLGGMGAADIKLLTGAMAALKGEINSLPPLLPSADISKSEKEIQALVQTADRLYEVWDRLSKESSTVSLAQGGVFDINSLEKTLSIIGQIEHELNQARKLTNVKYTPEYEGLISQVRSVQAPLGRLKAGAYSGLRKNLSQVKEAADAGDDTAQGFIDGFGLKADVIASVANKAGKDFIAEMKSVLGIASPAKVTIEIGKQTVDGWEIGLEDLDDVWMRSLRSLNKAMKTGKIEDFSFTDVDRLSNSIKSQVQAGNQNIKVDLGLEDLDDVWIRSLRSLNKAIKTGKIEDFSFTDVDRLSNSIKSQVQAGNQNIKVDQFGTVLEDEKPKVQRTYREIGFEIGSKTKEGIDQAAPVVKKAITSLSDGIINQLRIVAPGITGFIEGIGLDLDKLKSLGAAGLTLTAGAVGVGLFGGKILEVANNTADAATEQNRYKRILDQTVAGGGASYYQKLVKQSNDLGNNLQNAVKSATAIETSIQNTALAGTGVEILSGFQSQFAAQGTPDQDQARALVGIGQALRKNKLQAEELYQVIEPLPGAMEALQAATGKTGAELFRATAAGEVFTEDVIQSWSDQLKIVSGLSGSSNTAEASMGRLNNQTYLLAANVGQMTNVVRKVGTDLFGGALSVANNNALLLDAMIATLTVSFGVGFVAALIKAGATLFALTATSAVTQSALAGVATGLGTIATIAAPVTAAALAIAGGFALWELTKPSDDVEKLANNVKRLTDRLKELEAQRRKVDNPTIVKPTVQNLSLPLSGTVDPAAGYRDAFNDLASGKVKEDASKAKLDETLQRFSNGISESSSFLSDLKSNEKDLLNIKKLSLEIIELQGKSNVSKYEGDTNKTTKYNDQITVLTKQLGTIKNSSQLTEQKTILQGLIAESDKYIATQQSSSDPSSKFNIAKATEYKDKLKSIYEELNKIDGLSNTSLQKINVGIENKVLQADRLLKLKQDTELRIEAENIKQFGGSGTQDQVQLGVLKAKQQIRRLDDTAQQFRSYLEAYNKALKAITPKDKSDLASALASKGVTLESATKSDLEAAIKVLEAGDRKPSESLKTFVNSAAIAKKTAEDSLLQGAKERAQAVQDEAASQKALNDAQVDYARTIRDSNYELTKAISDHSRELKRAYEDTILETKKLQLEALNLSRNNNIRSRIQSTAGDFTDQLVGSIQQFLDQVNEAMSIKLEGAGARQGIDRKIQDLITTEEKWERDIAKQQEGLSDAVATQQGTPKNFADFSAKLGAITMPHDHNYGVGRAGGSRQHAGQDYDISGNQEVYAGVSGVVTKVGTDPGGYGNYIDIFNNQLKVVERIAEAATLLVKVGDKIVPGQLVGRGESETGVIHREIRTDFNSAGQGGYGFKGTVDPREFYKKHLPALFAESQNKADFRFAPGALNEEILAKINKFIEQYAPSSRLRGGDFAAASSASGVSIDALVTQALIESHFGTTGRAAYTKNPLNYGNDDEGNDKYFDSFRDGLIHAAKALKKDFFVSTPESFMGRGFKGRYGIYATDPQYLSKYKSALGLVRSAIGTPSSGAGGGAGYTDSGVVYQPDNSTVIGATANQLEAQKTAQSQLARLKAQKSTLDADATGRGIIRTLKDQITAELQASNTAQSSAQQRRDSILVQTPVTQVYGQLSQKTFADDSELIQKQRDLQKKQEDLAANNRLVTLLQGKLNAPNVPANFKTSYTEIIKLTGERNAKLKELIPTLQEEIETIKDTSPLRTFTRELRIAADSQISSAESVMSQLSQFNDQLRLPGAIDLAQTTRALSSQYRSLKESTLQQNEAYTASIQKTLELEAAQRKLGNLDAAAALKQQAERLAESALEFQSAANALTPAAEQVAIANAKLDALYKMRLDARKFVDALGAQDSTNLGLQAQIYEGAGDTYSANAIKRQVELMSKQKEISDRLLENENEIAKLRNKDSLTGDINSPLDAFGALGAGSQIEALEATNQKLREMMSLTEELAAQSFPTFEETMERTFAESGGGAVKEFFNSLNSGKGILESLGGAFSSMANTIIQKVLEMVSQIVQSKLLDLIKGLFGGGGLGNLGGFSGVTGVSFTSIPGFYSGGPVVGNLAGGGPVDLGLSAIKALDKERQRNGGQRVGLFALTHGEEVLDPKNAAFYRAIEANGIWDDLKANAGYDSPIGNRANGGPVGDYASVVNNRSSANNQSSISIPMSFSVESKTDEDAAKAIAPELQKRMEYTFNELWLQQQRQRGAIA
jgi:tape measure domain-containing protein